MQVAVWRKILKDAAASIRLNRHPERALIRLSF